jgi:hypothetical protein
MVVCMKGICEYKLGYRTDPGHSHSYMVCRFPKEINKGLGESALLHENANASSCPPVNV